VLIFQFVFYTSPFFKLLFFFDFFFPQDSLYFIFFVSVSTLAIYGTNVDYCPLDNGLSQGATIKSRFTSTQFLPHG